MIGILADPHMGDNTHDVDGSRRKLAEEMVDEVLDQLDAHFATTLVVPGDLITKVKPDPWAYLVATRLRDGCRKRGIAMFVEDGNHDAAKPGEVGPLEVLFDDRELISRPRVVEVEGLYLCFLPWVSRAYLASKITEQSAATQQAAMVDLLVSIAQKQLTESNGPAVSVTHFTISGAAYNSEVQPLLGEATEIVLPTAAFRGYDLVIAGHVHKAQEFENIVYPGAAMRHDFGEEDATPSIMFLDPATLERHCHPLPAQEFVTVEVAYISTEDSERYDMLTPEGGHVFDGAVVRLKGMLPAGPNTSEVVAEWRADILDRGALKVLDSEISYVRHEHREASTTTTATPPGQALEEFIEVVGGEYADNRELLLAKHAEILAEVQGA